MPGMMDTVLNLGLNDVTVEALAAPPATSASPTTPTADSSPCIQRGARRGHHHFEEALDNYKERKGYALDTDLTADDWKSPHPSLQGHRREGAEKPFPQDPHEQLWVLLISTVTAALQAGRLDADDITLFKSVGAAIEDLAAASLLVNKAKASSHERPPERECAATKA